MKKFLTIVTITIALIASASCNRRSSEMNTNIEVEECDTTIVDTTIVDTVVVE